jgi:DNA glycosylase AlkZ-like
VPDLEEAGMRAVESYFRAYGPATLDRVHYWLGAGRKRFQTWIAGFGDRLAAVDVDGEATYVLREDLEELVSTTATTATLLLPGSARAQPTPTSCRPPGEPWSAAGQISSSPVESCPARGRFSEDQVVVAWFTEAAPPAREPLAAEVLRLATILGRPLKSTVQMA